MNLGRGIWVHRQRLQKLFPEHKAPVNTPTVLEIENLSQRPRPVPFMGRAMSAFQSRQVKFLGLSVCLVQGVARFFMVSMVVSTQQARSP